MVTDLCDMMVGRLNVFKAKSKVLPRRIIVYRMVYPRYVYLITLDPRTLAVPLTLNGVSFSGAIPDGGE